MSNYDKNDALLPESVCFEGEMVFGKLVESEASNKTNNGLIDEPKPDHESDDPKLSNEPPTIESRSKPPENKLKHNTSHSTPPIPPPTSKIPFPHEQEPSNETINEEDTPPSRPRRAAAAKFAPGYYKKLRRWFSRLNHHHQTCQRGALNALTLRTHPRPLASPNSESKRTSCPLPQSPRIPNGY